MKKRICIGFAAFGCLSALAYGHGVPAEACVGDYKSSLQFMVQADQAVRERLSYDAMPPATAMKESDLPKEFQRMMIVDRINTRQLVAWVRKCGWPRKGVHGEAATGAAWMLAQHAEPATQKAFLPYLEKAARAGDASASDFAYLADRLAAQDGRLQLYGTQMVQKGQCEFEFEKFDSRHEVNERRKAIGMQSLEEYERQFKQYLTEHGCAQYNLRISTPVGNVK